jgi:hypothetical protein
MAIERKDIRAKLDDDMHAALKAICDIDGVDMGVFIEQLLVPVIQKRVHDAIALAEKLPRQGTSGKTRRSAGTAGNSEKPHGS